MPDQTEHPVLEDALEAPASSLAERLRKAIEDRGTNARAVADKAGLGPTYVRDITHGKVKSPTYAKLRQVAEALDVSAEYLMTGAADGVSSRPGSDGAESAKVSRAPKFTIEGDLVHIEATLDRAGVERLKGQLDHILSLMA